MTASSHAAPTREVALVVNLRSRSGPGALRKALSELERQGVVVRQRSLARSGPELMHAVRQAVEGGLRTIVVGGGDGTISSVVDLFAKRPELELGLLPLGTGNEVARILGIPLDLPGACRVVARGRPAAVDLAEASGDFFMHTALVGYPARVNHTIPPLLKLRFGKVAYVHSLLRSLLKAKPYRATVTAGTDVWEGETVVVVVGNGRFHTPARALLPGFDSMESKLVAYTPRDSRPITLLRLAVALWITHRPEPSLLLSRSADSVTVTADPPQEVDLDGEYGGSTPVGFRLARGALRVLVPDSPSTGE